MDLNDLLEKKGVDKAVVLVLRHRPSEPELARALPWLAAEKADLYNAYQQSHGEKLEKAMEGLKGKGFIVSCIAHGPGKALFVGLYSIESSKVITYNQFWNIPANLELKKFGMKGLKDPAASPKTIWFNLRPVEFYDEWQGKLVFKWPPPERSWWRYASRNKIPVESISKESLLTPEMPNWDQVVLAWNNLGIIPSLWKTTLSQWRGIYYIHDSSDGKGYVGSACGKSNLMGRWLDYAARGHGGNRLLRDRDPGNFRFSILQRVSPDMDPADLVRLENSWKERLHTRHPEGLNDN